jgi:hypothetical protein
MASNTVVEVNGRKVRGRLYPWGIVEGERYLCLHSTGYAALSHRPNDDVFYML